MAKYDASREGAVYSHGHIDRTSDEAIKAIDSDSSGRALEEAATLAFDVIRQVWDESVTFDESTLAIMRGGVAAKCSDDANSLVRDAFWLSEVARDAKSLRDALAATHPDSANAVLMLVSRAFQAGNITERILVRLDEIERHADIGRKVDVAPRGDEPSAEARRMFAENPRIGRRRLAADLRIKERKARRWLDQMREEKKSKK
ncbi:hypothetical protein [Crateriforma spongiae]|uniref:hypothetical protein n=1 Tax=Crateriforma spongiae TaxID=2724528 RepID=UPI0014475FEF|nr:hypothetical protein [Crateriforma spongiae]